MLLLSGILLPAEYVPVWNSLTGTDFNKWELVRKVSYLVVQ
jgi:hypothetical protein